MSLHYRLMIAASLVLVVFLGATGMILDRAFRESAETAARERLQGHLYTLLAAADLAEDGGLQITKQLPASRFSIPSSGLYARIIEPAVSQHTRAQQANSVQWQSRSVLDVVLPEVKSGDVGIIGFERYASDSGVPYFAVAMRVAWESNEGQRHEYIFQVIEDLQGFHSQVGGFRRSLWGWLAGVSLLLLAIQGTILRWSLSPLRKVSADLERIKTGKADMLEGDYPDELREVSSSINSFIQHERSMRNRYRDTLSDLAHSLKTPLAVVRGAVEDVSLDAGLRAEMQEQVERMRKIVDYQLQRAAASGRTILVAPISVASICDRIVGSLSKVYADKGVAFEQNISADTMFFGDEGDLMEVLGNLLDNACKWSHHRVRVGARDVVINAEGETGLELVVEDDGPGIAADQQERVLQRGGRADTRVAGHGIGLAVVRDIVEVYAGSIQLASSPMGGVLVRLTFPHPHS
jgi:two-component system sensor histidine kinase PhoQ